MDDLWQSPWADRYASKAMLRLFGAKSRAYHWRLMWYYLAKAQHQLGLPITHEQVEALKAHLESIDLLAVRTYEKELKHDVMAHLHAYADQAPSARAILHLGATSADITDNADMLMMRQGLKLIEADLVLTMHWLNQFAKTHAGVVTLGFTHFQSATATTVGKRATLWLESLSSDLDDLLSLIARLPMKGFKGATGSAESYHALFDGDYTRYREMEQLIATYAGFSQIQAVAGQTYDRKWDLRVMDLLNQIAVSAHKISNDLRLLQHLKEFEEPFSSQQVGSSAMAYKRNPMKAERVSALAKWVSSLHSGSVSTASTQWLERTLDDSAIRRLNIPQAFFGVNALLRLLQGIFHDGKVYDKVIALHLREELPFLLTEKMMMAHVQAGGDRQEAHEWIREASHTLTLALKSEGKKLDLIPLLLADKRCILSKETLEEILSSQAVAGFAKEQTLAYVGWMEERLAPYASWLEQADLPQLEV
ncbi:lyase family protein [Entomospira culicis]|uniref:Adenylosuccinate lyase n=1 Tax=Entomospira culicis TaxID=2719989 RepID=A0A968KWB8_9SPIO|nr:lyase family protein [Entomospira culicis]NIZ18807.1 adenylosuccinate lyase [Entomospira culicis]NIZ69022.1 adenylosuccinate lyase [Entomospira culicis]WDI37612.1 lyase family protein [Entomospira culicis]WDI39240.1 lyase family protein [Entomospira culicis]